MKPLRIAGSLFIAIAMAAAALAADPSGTWKWTTQSPGGDIATTLKLEMKDGKITGAYSNQFGDAMISNASFANDAITFDVVREFNGNKFVVHYHGKLQGDAITGTIEAPSPDGGEGVKLDWNAKRDSHARSAKAPSK